MKLKKPTASTGHGTGVLQERPMRHRLAKRRHRLRILAPFRRGLHDERGRSVPRKSAANHRRVPPKFDLEGFWQGLFEMPKRETPTSGPYTASFAEQLQECGTAREASKLLHSKHAPGGASPGTQRKWSRIVERKRKAEAA